jgi:hypothetical protein
MSDERIMRGIEIPVRPVEWGAMRRCFAVGVVVAVLVGGCGDDSDSASEGAITEPTMASSTTNLTAGNSESASVVPATELTVATAAPPADLTYVALGDSWPEGAHCNGCQPFPELHAEALQTQTGRTIEFKNLAGQAQPGFETLGRGMASLLDAVRTDEAFRTEVASGDIIVVSTGPNEGEAVTAAVAAGTCGGSDNLECVRELGQSWSEDLDGILVEIEQLRSGQPTAVRLVNAANAFIGTTLPGMDGATSAAFSELFFEELTVAMCENASAHGAECLDVRPILNGPGLDQPVDDSSIESMAAVADALTLMGVSELG